METSLPRIDSREAAAPAPEGFRWLRLERARWTDAAGHPREWELATRTGKGGAVAVLAWREGAEGREIVVVRQFRPPVGAHVIEFPAGLVDEGEAPGRAALRELAEETGFSGRVVHEGFPLFSSPGLTDESTVFVEVEITSSGPAKPDEGEAIEVAVVPLRRLATFLAGSVAAGDRIDAKLGAYVAGLSRSSPAVSA